MSPPTSRDGAHVAAVDPTRLKASPELDAERAKLIDEYGRSLLDESGLLPIASLQALTLAKQRQLLREFPLTGNASVARWMGAGLERAYDISTGGPQQ
jgi:hypothetical protein